MPNNVRGNRPSFNFGSPMENTSVAIPASFFARSSDPASPSRELEEIPENDAERFASIKGDLANFIKFLSEISAKNTGFSNADFPGNFNAEIHRKVKSVLSLIIIIESRKEKEKYSIGIIKNVISVLDGDKFTDTIDEINVIISAVLLLNVASYPRAFDLLRGIIKQPLQPLLDDLGYAIERQNEVVKKLASAIMKLESSLTGTWSASIREERRALDVRTPLSLPSKAPAIWRDDKLPGDTPPDFIKRHYSPWLRPDASGLTRPALNKLDSTLYSALANWLQRPGNTLPDDCPVPKKSQVVDSLLASRESRLGDLTVRELWRMQSAQRRRG